MPFVAYSPLSVVPRCSLRENDTSVKKIGVDRNVLQLVMFGENVRGAYSPRLVGDCSNKGYTKFVVAYGTSYTMAAQYPIRST